MSVYLYEFPPVLPPETRTPPPDRPDLPNRTKTKDEQTPMNASKHALAILAVVGLLIGVAIGYPLGNKTVTKVKSVPHNIAAQLAIGESEAVAIQTLNTSKKSVLQDQTIGGRKFHCVQYYGHLDSNNDPTDWFATFCGK